MTRHIAEIRPRLNKMTDEIGETSEQLPPVLEDIRRLQQQNESSPEEQRNLPKRFLLTGPRSRYVELAIPLYEASIKCDWDAANKILTAIPNLVKYSITENGDTALHVAASAKVPKLGVVFVENLVGLMKDEDLALQNVNSNTALYLAAAVGNFETVQIMVKKNRDLVKIPGGAGDKQMLPLYAAALVGNYNVVKYLFEMSNDLCDDDGWNDVNRGWLLKKCVENDMLDIALEILKMYPELGRRNVLALLARKPEAFRETQSAIKGRVFKLGNYLYSMILSTNQRSKNKHSKPGSVSASEILDQKTKASSIEKTKSHWRGKHRYSSMFVMHQLSGKRDLKPANQPVPEDLNEKPEASNETKQKAPANESIALQVLKIIWKDIEKRPKNEIDRILRGPPDLNKQDKSATGRVVQVMQLQKLISVHIHEVDGKIRWQPNTALVKNLIFESLANLHTETQNIIRGPGDSNNQDNKLISGKEDQALELQKLISEYILNTHDKIQRIDEMTVKENQEAIQLKSMQKVISDHNGKMKTESQKIIRRPAKKTHSSRILFIAAKMGNTEFLVELIRQYPDLIWQVDDNNQTIFHIAVTYRHASIYNLLYEIGAMKDLITPLRDPKENNMLHLVGMSAKKEQLEDVYGVGLQMQRELLWFQEVEKMIPPSYREQKNKDGLTPHELFTKEHQEMVTEGEKWMKKIAAQCIVVAALVATMVFTAAFTVPGGYDQKNGIPIFHSKLSFQIFMVADAISLFLSTASILCMFLSVFTSRYAERDFLVSVPKKLIVGLTYLFLSITSMIIAFCSGFFILYHKGLLWMPILISVFALIPFFLYFKVQFSLFRDVIPLTFGSRHLFNPKKRILYYENPKF